ncbi:hypothetical protein SDC9_156895 [bioreactor metagenome]|uniref:Ammonium transporter AmtB-like domain-containing protein n=1 Tax=bioreactor metagenome TaxID=1076179 RepID=A0A645FAM3_9ZZZZ
MKLVIACINAVKRELYKRNAGHACGGHLRLRRNRILLPGSVAAVVAVGAAAFPAALLIFFIIKKTIGLRVTEDEELRGLDLGEHGMGAYAGFQIFANQ